MKSLHILHALVTALLLAGVVVFVILLLTGLVQVRRRSQDAISPARARLVVLRGLHPNWEYFIF